MNGLLAFFNRLQPRERKLLTTGAGALVVLLAVGLPIGLEFFVQGKRSDLEEVRAALSQVQAARAQVKERQAKKDALAARYAKKAPPLAGLLEELAKPEKLTVTDAQDRPDTPHGKRFNERLTVIHFKKVGMGPVIRFTEAIEKSGFPVTLSRLNLRKRSNEVDSFDVEVGLSAFDRNEPAKKEPTQ
jgi:general secretion pathway protein M